MSKTVWQMGDISPYEANPRRISEEAVKAVARSIELYGMRQPIVIDGDGIIIAGHTRYQAMQSLGHTEAWVEIADDLTPEQVREYRLVDNRMAELTGWDIDSLAKEVDEMMLSIGENGERGELSLTGFDEGELAALSAMLETFDDDDAADGDTLRGDPSREHSDDDRPDTTLLSFHVPKASAAEIKPRIDALIAPYFNAG